MVFWSAVALAAAPPGPHAAQMAELGAGGLTPLAAPMPALPTPTLGPDKTVYGYVAYWDDDLNTLEWDDLSHVAIFAAEATTSGGLTSTSRWDIASDAVSMSKPYGVKVHLCVINFSTSELGTLLGSSSARASLIADLRAWQVATGADGINVDFEGMPSSRRAEMVTFTKDLAAEVGEVVLATPAVDWSGAWDYSELTKHADLFIMGYAYHYSGSTYAGPNDPLYGGGAWSAYSLSWTVDDYLTEGADPDRVILGLPLYGIEWPVSSHTVPAATTGTGSSVFYADSIARANQHGRKLDVQSATPYYDNTSTGRQGWYADADSVIERTDYAIDEGLQGIGFWALNYDEGDPKLWGGIRPLTHTAPIGGDDDDDDDDDDDTDTDAEDGSGTSGGGGVVANAGNPFLAYPGDTVELSAASSEGRGLSYRWTQVEGPNVSLSDDTAEHPRFTVNQPGVHVFELEVTDGTHTDVDRSRVTVIDGDAGRFLRTKGCSQSPLGPSLWVVLAVVALARRED